MIKIISRQNGFRRCGIPHSSEPTTYPDDRFTTKELAILEADPMLVVVKVPDALPVIAETIEGSADTEADTHQGKKKGGK